MPKKLNFLALLSFLTLGTCMIACTKSSPRKTLEEYFKHLDEGNYTAMYELVSADDREVKSLQEYEKDASDLQEWAVILKSLASKVKRKIVNVEIKGNTAKVQLEIEMPDTEKMMGELFKSALSSIFDKDENATEEILKKTLEKYENKPIPMTKKNETVKLVKEQGNWKIFLNLRKAKLAQEAVELENDNQYIKALEKYRAAKNTDPESSEFDNQILKLDSTVAEMKVREAYFTSLEVLDVKADYYETWLDGILPGIKFRIKNNGDRTLASVKVTAYFMDEENKVIYEESYTPFNTNFDYDNNKPLKPGYIWNLASGEFLKAEQCPKEWKAGNVTVKVTDLEFYTDNQ